VVQKKTDPPKNGFNGILFYALLRKGSGEWTMYSATPTTSPLKEKVRKVLKELTAMEEATEAWSSTVWGWPPAIRYNRNRNPVGFASGIFMSIPGGHL